MPFYSKGVFGVDIYFISIWFVTLCDCFNIVCVVEKEQCHLADSISHSIKCTHYGHKVEIEEHNVTVIIPKGAVEKGHIAAIEVSASLFGSYKIPNGHSRISPYVSIGTEYDFKEHLIVEVEHHAVITKEQDITSLRIMEVQKGSRSGYQSYDDEMCEASSNYPGHCKIRSTVYTYKTKSKCTCVVKKTDSVAVPDYVIVRQFLPKNYAELDDFTIEICLCCNLKYLKKVGMYLFPLRLHPFCCSIYDLI